MNYFVIRVPLSYLNAVEAQYYYKIKPEESTLVILCQERYPVDLKIIKTILDASLWQQIYYVSYNLSAFRLSKNKEKKQNRFFDLFHKISAIKEFVKELDSIKQTDKIVSRVFIGNENTASMRHIVNSIKPEEIVIIDEGFAVINNYAEKIKAIKGKLRIFSTKAYIKEFFAATMFGYKIKSLRNVIYFSSYELGNDNNIILIKNTYEKLRLDLSNQTTIKQVLFLGQPLVENFHMTEDVYINL